MDAALNCDHPIDLLITDVIMPDGMTGVDLARRIRAEKPSIPVIFMSGYNNELVNIQRDFPSTGAYLPKPFRPTELATLVRASLDRRTVALSANN